MKRKYASSKVQEAMKPSKAAKKRYSKAEEATYVVASNAEEATADDVLRVEKEAKVSRSTSKALRKAADEHEAMYRKPERLKTVAYDGEVRKIKVKPEHVGRIVPASVFRIPAFKFEPEEFECVSPLLNRVIDPSIQWDSMNQFLENPKAPMVYGISGVPDDTRARYFAAFLVAHHLRVLGQRANVLWETLYGGFDNKLLRDYSHGDRMDPTLLVLTNLDSSSGQAKLEKAKDLLERFPNIPRLVVAAGEDPMSFVSTRLHSPIHGLAYFSASYYVPKIKEL
ncbi:hypothetical protein [Burkholderia phage BCSR5]|nr:hypothetical protein [Burkholderia phage BCSR5]